MSLFSEEFHLKDGSKLLGRIIGANGESLYVETSSGDVQVPRANIQSIEFLNHKAKTPVAPAQTLSAQVSVPLSGGSYVHYTGKFSLNVPSGWMLCEEWTREEPEPAAAFASPDRSLLVMVTVEEYGGALAAYKSLVELQNRTNFGDYKKLSESEIELDGRTGSRLIWKATHGTAEGASLKALVVLLPYAHRMVRLTCLTTEPLFEDALPTFENILHSYASV